MQTSPLLTPHHALFLDFDGTLADIAAQPHAVQVLPEVVPTLQALHQHLGGALAIVTGRTMADIDYFLAPLKLPLACEHGAQYRMGNGYTGGVPSPDLTPVIEALRPLLSLYPQLLLEPKSAGLALHYRQAIELEPLCQTTMEQALLQVPGMELMQGKCVLEVKPSGPSKGRAIADFMRQAPFHGRTPIFVGDDVTDEAGFAATQELGGTAVKVGPGDTLALARVESPAAVRTWLQQAALTFLTPPTRSGIVP
ncbi:MAG: trehalose-phosphatase [Comamonadaceae bacterium]|nr:MAG: trehalose-phosphatase [Comamonadaceae bacterium]